MRVLLVEDHPALRQLLSEELTVRGFAVDAAGSTADGSAALRTFTYDAVVLDLGLPDRDGMTFLTELRSTGLAVPVLILTARASVSDRVLGLNAGADDYLVKPFDVAELEARLRAILRRPGGRTEPILHFGPLAFDPATREASVAGTVVELRRREMTLLEELLRANGQIVVRDRLEDRLYAQDEPVTPNALDVAVSRLRRALRSACADLTVEARRGIGFRLVCSRES